MTRRIRLAVVLASLCLTGLAGVASAQNAPPAGPPPARGGARAAQRSGAPPPAPQVNVQRLENQIQDVWNTLVLKRSKTFLELSDEKYPSFFLKMSSLQELRDRHVRDRRKLLNELRVMTNPQKEDQSPARPLPTDAELVTKARQLDDLEATFAQQERVGLQAIDEVLTPFQRVRFRVFEEQMDVQKMQMLMQAGRNVPAVAPAPQPGANGEQPAAAVKPGRGGGN